MNWYGLLVSIGSTEGLNPHPKCQSRLEYCVGKKARFLMQTTYNHLSASIYKSACGLVSSALHWGEVQLCAGNEKKMPPCQTQTQQLSSDFFFIPSQPSLLRKSHSLKSIFVFFYGQVKTGFQKYRNKWNISRKHYKSGTKWIKKYILFKYI